MLILILAVIFVLGWPLEWVPIVLIVVPILLPLVSKLGIDLVWFCTLVAVCLQTAWLSPPVALSAYFLKGVVPDWKLTDIYRDDAVHGAAVDRAGLLLRSRSWRYGFLPLCAEGRGREPGVEKGHDRFHKVMVLSLVQRAGHISSFHTTKPTCRPLNPCA